MVLNGLVASMQTYTDTVAPFNQSIINSAGPWLYSFQVASAGPEARLGALAPTGECFTEKYLPCLRLEPETRIICIDIQGFRATQVKSRCYSTEGLGWSSF